MFDFVLFLVLFPGWKGGENQSNGVRNGSCRRVWLAAADGTGAPIGWSRASDPAWLNGLQPVASRPGESRPPIGQRPPASSNRSQWTRAQRIKSADFNAFDVSHCIASTWT